MALDDVVINLGSDYTDPWGGERREVETSHGPISVLVCGDQSKPALVTYPDVGLNYLACFEGLFSFPEATSVLYHNFCIYHVDPPGHQDGAAEIPADLPLLSMEDLADQVAEVLDHFGVHEMIGLGVGAGSYILNLFAIKYRERAIGLILVSPICRKPSWSEWLYNKAMINILYYCGATNFVKDSLLQRYFSQEVRASPVGAEVLDNYRKHFGDHPSRNIMRYMQSIHQRADITENLRKLKCRTLVIVGENSPFHSEALHMSTVMRPRYQALIEVQACGSLVTEEQPQSMIVPIELFLMFYTFYKRPVSLSSPKSSLSPPCVSPELLSSESMGLKLKPIKTRVSR
ncbi:protein NDL2 [Physcomitrium patens]|uniref:Uncharacterized protein n=1 Tax=Physcomitrium patens TaxID=3218 RepID=A0A2K1IFR0_PHYPA|nr:protein NDL2-like [Physcomitrium patens]XP_024363333.1 protein NDL2-like [Physcomitrium patens]XP_024363335.1 protein NDL2-like [Physcomitrium patens]XP_024363336.1 protein NDL2-like [Physcomitrium patens]XP_024363337.1 protein NDL2-like [Physcomitrium patens]XP_024363338.1 protein NDL2-like [Physcomitrium patens]PNR28115.1 hypothetical protein PHYPA_028707 [Physcomitrium patens]|eukprot:XP_024363332.1 protein NDL2-like [Physcomitrella patens]